MNCLETLEKLDSIEKYLFAKSYNGTSVNWDAVIIIRQLQTDVINGKFPSDVFRPTMFSEDRDYSKASEDWKAYVKVRSIRLPF